MEQWIQNAYSLLRQEPTRVIEGIYSQDEMDAEEAEVMGQRSRDSTGSSIGGGSGSVGDGGHQFGYGAASGELFSSGEFGSLGSEGLIAGSLEDVRVHDTSVDPDLSDDEYGRRVIDHVISPSPEPEEGEGEGEGEGSSVDQTKEYDVGFAMSATEVSVTAALELGAINCIFSLPYSWKIWWGIKFVGLALKSAKISYSHIYVWRSCTEPPNLNPLIFL